MIFEALFESCERGELILLNGAMCRFHLRRDGQLTIHEILVQPDIRGKRWGVTMLTRLRQRPGVRSIVARCPADLRANDWYRRWGFALERTETARSGREINVWRLDLSTVTGGTPPHSPSLGSAAGKPGSAATKLSIP